MLWMAGSLSFPSMSCTITVVSPWVSFTPRPSVTASRTRKSTAKAKIKLPPLRAEGEISPIGGTRNDATRSAMEMMRQIQSATVVLDLTFRVAARKRASLLLDMVLLFK